VFFFKVYRYGLRTELEIQTEIQWLLHLKVCEVYSTEPIEKKDGTYIQEFDTIQGKRYGVLFSFVGVRGLDAVDETDALNKKIGKYLASVHSALDSMVYTPHRSELDSQAFLEIPMQHKREFSQMYPLDLEFLEVVACKTKKKIEALSKTVPQYGICHGDVYSGNIRLTEEDTPVLFDFDFSGYGWRAYDISLYGSPFGWGARAEDMPKREKRKAAILDGYAEIRALSQEEVKSIDLFTPFRRIFNIGIIYISMANTWGDEWAYRNSCMDIQSLKNWLDLHPVL
jgi:Ser/Thr protein kinase RdoA (MazF antagonist)